MGDPAESECAKKQKTEIVPGEAFVTAALLTSVMDAFEIDFGHAIESTVQSQLLRTATQITEHIQVSEQAFNMQHRALETIAIG
jgi:hypothetical protein